MVLDERAQPKQGIARHQETKKLSLDVDPVSGAEVEALIREVYASPSEAVHLAAESTKPIKE